MHGIRRDESTVRVRHDDDILARVRQRRDLAVEVLCVVGQRARDRVSGGAGCVCSQVVHVCLVAVRG